MLDPKFIRENPDKIKAIINSGRGNPKKADVDRWLEIDSKRKELLQELDELNRKKNELAKQGGQGNVEDVRQQGKVLKEQSKKIEKELEDVNSQWQNIIDWIPNIPVSDEAMPVGDSEEDNPIIKAWSPREGYVDKALLGKAVQEVPYAVDRSIHWDNQLNSPKHHLELGKLLGIIDTEQSAKVSGARFTYLIGDAVLLQYALQQLLFSELLSRNFTPMIPPLLVKDRSLYGTSHFPEGRDQVYQIKKDYVEENEELNLVGSSEPANFSYFMGKILRAEKLPIKMFAMTTCFRSEAGSWGKDVRGIKRLHQFDKIEMNAVCMPDQSEVIFAEFLDINEWLLQQLELPYRLSLKCTGDAGYHASAHQVDPEVWLPGQKEFIEFGTDTNTTDFQARRLNIRFKMKDGKKGFVHTVNDTGVAMGRMIIAIIDNYQQSDGSIVVPEVLRKWMGKEVIGKQS